MGATHDRTPPLYRVRLVPHYRWRPVLMAWSVDLPAINPNWFFDRCPLLIKCPEIRLAIIRSKVLPSMEIRPIGRYAFVLE
ncbi:hypothetical protein DERF_000845 [Dermatophagoides farinae]|uniref:Uncharacterized protein n=1 Tax=Dermatophagoides farinae TaxID=6954 RepID=A0A922ICF3_DERFA|nr:hypothetical protein DERF_000845 [Dermatophagoides farinae]